MEITVRIQGACIIDTALDCRLINVDCEPANKAPINERIIRLELQVRTVNI